MDDSILNTDSIDDSTLKRNMEDDQSTNEQHQQHSTTEPTKETQKELIEETSQMLEKLKEVTEVPQRDKKLIEKKKQIKNIENPFKNLTPRVTQLVYWENPIHSGALLAVSLSFLIFTAYYSLFNTFCALAVILMGANWIYVMGRKQLQSLINQKPVNPHEHLLVNEPWYIERDDVEKYLDTTIDTVNYVLLEVQKIVLVDDPMRTIRHVIMFYVLWTLGTWISFRTLFGIGLILSFSTPIAYEKNKELVDEKLYQSNKFLRSYLDRGLSIAKQHTGGVYEKAKSFAVKKGFVTDDTTAKKEE
ncbi:hypothetical protein RclHR1_04160007 [Rhizophagus clarus]|uniref:Reticulon-like protein n=1 Tax=Rhizophagus clarus TaxID=94130 RepID=A0A2Z6RWJ2_9GLOM|nr:hypothetical protein RclHR1_04160007 [Rhizophagus clarus]